MATSEMDYMNIGGQLRYKEIAVAAANQTYAQQLAQLKTTWDILTTDEKMRCVIVLGNVQMYSPSYFSVGMFCSLYCNANKFYSYNFDIANCKNYSWNSIDHLTPYDSSSDNNTNELSLMLLCNY